MKNLKRTAIIILTASILFILMLSTNAQATTGTINKETVNLRAEASTSSKILKQLDNGDKVEILEELGEWYKVEFKSTTGYISKNLLTVEKNTAIEEPTTNEIENNSTENNNQENPEETVPSDEKEAKKEITLNNKYILNSEIEIRIIPLMNAIKSTKLAENTQITILDNMNNWYYIETENDSGWVRKQVLENTITLSQNAETTDNTTNQQEPNEEKDIPTTVEPTIPENEKEQVRYTEYESAKTGYISAATVNFRKEANTSSAVIKKLTRNTELQILGITTDNWYKITVKGTTGFVSAEYVSDTKVVEPTTRGMSSTEINNQVEVSTEKTIQEATSETTAPAETTTSTSSIGNQIVAYAKTFLGTKYVSGGSNPSTGFDCSGFTKYVYAKFGITLNRVSYAQANNGVAVSKSELIPGDLLIFNGDSNTSIGHVGIYIGENQFIHASNPSDGVKITSLSDSYYVKRYVGARRVF